MWLFMLLKLSLIQSDTDITEAVCDSSDDEVCLLLIAIAS